MEKHQQRNNTVKRRPIRQRAEYITAHMVHGVLKTATSCKGNCCVVQVTLQFQGNDFAACGFS